MDKNYEFGYQSKKQKAILLAARLVILAFMADSFYSLGWLDVSLEEKLKSIAGASLMVWMYLNISSVKIEIKELFVPPFDINRGLEFMFLALSIYVFYTLRTIFEIAQLHL